MTGDERIRTERAGRRSWEVLLRRNDGSDLRLASTPSRFQAEQAAERAWAALADQEVWILRLMDVSAGEMRSA